MTHESSPAASYEDFLKVEIRAGTVLSAQPLEGARKPAFVLEIDFGPFGVKRSSAQITDLYTSETLVGRQVAAVVNLPPKRIGKFVSECLVTGFPNQESSVVLVSPDSPVPNGARLF
jgi:tRNA-binding protein